jgi:hypothetical protein
MEEDHHEQQGKEEILAVEEFAILPKGNHMLLVPMVKLDSYLKNRQSHHTNEKEVNIKW